MNLDEALVRKPLLGEQIVNLGPGLLARLHVQLASLGLGLDAEAPQGIEMHVHGMAATAADQIIQVLRA